MSPRYQGIQSCEEIIQLRFVWPFRRWVQKLGYESLMYVNLFSRCWTAVASRFMHFAWKKKHISHNSRARNVWAYVSLVATKLGKHMLKKVVCDQEKLWKYLKCYSRGRQKTITNVYRKNYCYTSNYAIEYSQSSHWLVLAFTVWSMQSTLHFVICLFLISLVKHAWLEECLLYDGGENFVHDR